MIFSLELSGRRALVPGGTKGVGAAVVEVVLFGRDQAAIPPPFSPHDLTAMDLDGSLGRTQFAQGRLQPRAVRRPAGATNRHRSPALLHDSLGYASSCAAWTTLVACRP
jgi:hypothetical protein